MNPFPFEFEGETSEHDETNENYIEEFVQVHETLERTTTNGIENVNEELNEDKKHEDVIHSFQEPHQCKHEKISISSSGPNLEMLGEQPTSDDSLLVDKERSSFKTKHWNNRALPIRESKVPDFVFIS